MQINSSAPSRADVPLVKRGISDEHVRMDTALPTGSRKLPWQ
jgi:hypothetical protein